MLLGAGAAQAGVCPTDGTEIQDPVPFQWINSGGYWSGTLEIGEATFPDIGGDSLTTRAYRQDPGEVPGADFSIPGPTMTMTPGETYVLTFKNTLDWEPPSLEHNVLKDPNITNIHTHGLHVSGETPADDVTRLINGGECGDYVYEIPDDHMGGTLWYHAHHHGSTWLQVAGGAFGLLIVDDPVIHGVPQGVLDMTDRQLAIAYLDPDVAGAGGDTLVSGTLSPTWTVNGLVGGNLCSPADEWQHWRVLLADADARMKTVSVGPECEAVLMARDGVWRRAGPVVLESNEIELTGASRADLAVRCSGDSTISVGNTVVANVVVGGDGNQDVGPNTGGATGDLNWSANRPAYLRDLRDLEGQPPVPVADTQNISMGARSVNGGKFDAEVASFDVNVPGVQEWTVKGATNHPFHLHVYHQQMQATCNGFEEGEHYDTIAGSGCVVRFDADPATQTAYDGRTIMHCHILNHEDQGAMTWANVQVGGFGPPVHPNYPNGEKDLYQCAEGPPVCEPSETELTCDDGLDNDCDGLIDAADPDCGDPPPQVECSEIPDRKACRAEPSCDWSGKNKVCEPAA
jgi:FtsP/CotA-like multicopper oxidase with cupredoxin domain